MTGPWIQPALAIAVLLAAGGLAAGCTRFGVVPVTSPGPTAGPSAGSAGAAGSLALGSGTHRLAITVDGRTRSYLLHLPPTLGTDLRPLIVELHGGGGTAAGMERLTRLSSWTDRRGWLVVAPDGVERRWNDGRPGVGSGVDDVAFIRALIDDVAGRTPVDGSRIFATGISNGAMMSGRLACDLADRIAAVAQVAGTVGVEARAACAPARPLSVLVIAGTADPLVPYGGGLVGGALGLSRGAVVGAEQYVADWLARDGIPPTARTTRSLPPDTTVMEADTDGGPRVAFYAVAGGGHTWPGGPQYLPRFLVGSTTRTFDASQVIVDFFAGIPARASG
ncbi:MAG: alpha/beta hydrolase family esterase [Candidatus Limnocylindrales bacterium]